MSKGVFRKGTYTLEEHRGSRTLEEYSKHPPRRFGNLAGYSTCGHRNGAGVEVFTHDLLKPRVLNQQLVDISNLQNYLPNVDYIRKILQSMSRRDVMRRIKLIRGNMPRTKLLQFDERANSFQRSAVSNFQWWSWAEVDYFAVKVLQPMRAQRSFVVFFPLVAPDVAVAVTLAQPVPSSWKTLRYRMNPVFISLHYTGGLSTLSHLNQGGRGVAKAFSIVLVEGYRDMNSIFHSPTDAGQSIAWVSLQSEVSGVDTCISLRKIWDQHRRQGRGRCSNRLSGRVSPVS